MFGHTYIWNSRWMVQVSGRGLDPGFQNWSANHQPMFLNQISDFKKLSQGFQYQSTNSDSNSRPGIKIFGREFKFSVKRFRCVTGYLKFRISESLPGLNLAIISGGIGVKILEAVDWLLQILNQPSHLKSAAGTRISCSQSLEASSSFFKLSQASSRFLKQQSEPESVATEIRRQKTNHKNDAFCRISP